MSDKSLGLGGGNFAGAGFKKPETTNEGSLPKDDVRPVGGSAKGVTGGGAAPKGPAKMDNADGSNGPKMNKGKGDSSDGKTVSGDGA